MLETHDISLRVLPLSVRDPEALQGLATEVHLGRIPSFVLVIFISLVEPLLVCDYSNLYACCLSKSIPILYVLNVFVCSVED